MTTVERKPRNVSPWRFAFLDEEPIHCAAPMSTSPNDNACSRTENESDESVRSAKRARYEYHGRRYLEGKPIFIASASLRGPFNTASGWRNPWLPSTPSQPGVPSTEAMADSLVCQHPTTRPTIRIPSTTSDTSSLSDDSTNCHLPSPESNPGLEFAPEPTISASRPQIEAWAKDVHPLKLEHDEFWAPELPPRYIKRTGSRDWLKRRPPKRFNPATSQSEPPASTPTPAAPFGLISKRKTGSQLTQTSASRSLEMTTPSSSPDNVDKEGLPVKEIEVSSTNSDDGKLVSEVSSPKSWESSQTPQQDATVEGERNSPGLLSQQQLQRESLEYLNAKQADTGFRSCADDSFNYRARRTLHISPSVTSGNQIEISTQFDTVPPVAPGEVAIAPDPGSIPNGSEGEEFVDSGDSDGNGPEPAATHAKLEQRPEQPGSSALSHERAVWSDPPENYRMDDNLFTSMKVANTLQDLSSGLNVLRQVPQTVLEVKEAQGYDHASTIQNAHNCSSHFDDEEPTLIGDHMQLDGEERLSNLENDTFSNAELEITAKPFNGGGEFASERLDKTRDELAATTDRQIETDAQVNDARASHLFHEELLSVSPDSSSTVRSEINPLNVAQGGCIESQEQSDWVSPITASFHRATTEATEQLTSYSITELASLSYALYQSSAPLDHSPAVRPSQQSPWFEKEYMPEYTTATIEPARAIGCADRDFSMAVEQKMPTEEQQDQEGPGPEASKHAELLHETPEQNPSKARDPTQTPEHRYSRQSTPEVVISVKSFATFDLSSPPRSHPWSKTSTARGILSSGKYSGSGGGAKPNKRVSFAPLPHEQVEDDHLLSPTKPSRAASPPPNGLVQLDGENVDGRYRGHFEAINKRLENGNSRQSGIQRRLLPDLSQEGLASPSIEAMAEAFREADALGLTPLRKSLQDEHEHMGGPQSPWQHQSQEIDPVADVMSNLDEFLSVWDVHEEMSRHRIEPEVDGLPRFPVLGDSGIW